MKAFALAAALLATPALAQSPSPAEETALKALAAEADAAWNAGDAARMTAAYAPDGSLRLGSAPAIEGQPAIRAQFEAAFAARRRTMRHMTRLDRIELVRPGIAVSDAAVTIEQQQADGAWRPVGAFRNITIATRGSRRWRLQTVRAVPVPLQN